MKKLFTTVLLLGAVGLAQAITVDNWNASTGELTITYNTGDASNLDDIKSTYSGKVQTLVLKGTFTNSEFNTNIAGSGQLIASCAASGGLVLNMLECSGVMSKYLGVSNYGGEHGLISETTSSIFDVDFPNKHTEDVDVQQKQSWVDGNGNTLTYGTPYPRDGKWYVKDYWENGHHGEEFEVFAETYYFYYDNGKEVRVPNELVKNGKTSIIVGDELKFDDGVRQTKIKGFISPNNNNFTFIPNYFLHDTDVLTTVVLSDKIKAIGNYAFGHAHNLNTMNFPNTLVAIGMDAFKNTAFTSIDLSNTKIDMVRAFTFHEMANLESILLPSTITQIQIQAFEKCRKLEKIDVSHCHQLRMIAEGAFNECEGEGANQKTQGLKEVRICSDPKTIKGGAMGAFHNCRAIKTVEIVGCAGTDVTQCVCENRAFEYDITHNQTAALNAVETCARLIYPRNMQLDMIVKSNTTPYTSSFDYFVGDYKAGALIKQENLLAYYRQVPADGYGKTKDENDNEITLDEPTYKGNGWLEFLNVGEFVPIIPKNGKFLRTYSRDNNSGPVLLPTGEDAIHAYRVLDYISTGSEVNDNNEEITVTGYISLKELTVTVDGEVRGYVPENTGVVFYSSKMEEDAGLVLNPYTNEELDDLIEQKKYDEVEEILAELFPQFPNTGEDYYCYNSETNAWEGNPNANMLQGSFGDRAHVSPTSPWVFSDDLQKYPYGGYYTLPRLYRNFSLDATNKVWKRMKVGYLRANRAFAQLPTSRFNNENEDADMNKLNEEDNGLNTNSAVSMIFDGDVTGIVTVDAKGNIVENDAWYTLQGVKVAVPTKGIYIHNRKKVVIK